MRAQVRQVKALASAGGEPRTVAPTEPPEAAGGDDRAWIPHGQLEFRVLNREG